MDISIKMIVISREETSGIEGFTVSAIDQNGTACYLALADGMKVNIGDGVVVHADVEFSPDQLHGPSSFGETPLTIKSYSVEVGDKNTFFRHK